jgi:sec-independent protein translocase protein TatC
VEDTPRPFLDHLEELRLRLIKSLIAVTAGTILSYYWADPVIAFLARPVGKFVFVQPTEAFLARLKIALVMGIILALPVCIYQIWKFVVIAFTPTEKKSLVWILPSAYVLFMIGAALGFFVILPAGIQFLISCGSPVLAPMLSIDQYLDFAGVICLVLGGIFQMPLVTLFLSRFGGMDDHWLSEKRRLAVLGIYIFSAFVTPGPDPVSAMLVAVPTYLLYEASILTCKWGKK